MAFKSSFSNIGSTPLSPASPIPCTRKSTAVVIDGSALNLWKLRCGVRNLCQASFIDSIVPATCRVDSVEIHFGVQYPNHPNFNPQFDKDTRKFFAALERADSRWKVVLGRIQVKAGGQYGQKQVDTAMALSLHRKALLKEFDRLVFVGSDGDFVPVVKAVQEAGTPIVIAVPEFGGSACGVSKELLQQAGKGVIRIKESDFHAHAKTYMQAAVAA